MGYDRQENAAERQERLAGLAAETGIYPTRTPWSPKHRVNAPNAPGPGAVNLPPEFQYLPKITNDATAEIMLFSKVFGGSLAEFVKSLKALNGKIETLKTQVKIKGGLT